MFVFLLVYCFPVIGCSILMGKDGILPNRLQDMGPVTLSIYLTCYGLTGGVVKGSAKFELRKLKT